MAHQLRDRAKAPKGNRSRVILILLSTLVAILGGGHIQRVSAADMPRHFEVPEGDRAKHRVFISNGGRTILVRHLGRDAVTYRSEVDVRIPPKDWTKFAKGNHAICDVKLSVIGPPTFKNDELPLNVLRLSPLKNYSAIYYAGRDGKWLAKCADLLPTCQSILIERQWTVHLIVGKKDLCAADRTAQLVSQIVRPWLK